MFNFNLRTTIALGVVSSLLIVEFSMFYEFFYPFQFLWDQGKILEFFLSLILFFWNLLCVFPIFFSGRSFFSKNNTAIFPVLFSI